MGIRYDAYRDGEPDPYINPDPRCSHGKIPFDGLAFCFGYARAVDAGKGRRFRAETCPTCGMWKAGRKVD